MGENEEWMMDKEVAGKKEEITEGTEEESDERSMERLKKERERVLIKEGFSSSFEGVRENGPSSDESHDSIVRENSFK
jgi:hypothetical protein